MRSPIWNRNLTPTVHLPHGWTKYIRAPTPKTHRPHLFVDPTCGIVFLVSSSIRSRANRYVRADIKVRWWWCDKCVGAVMTGLVAA